MPLMKHWVPQVPPLQTSPLPQPVPSGSLDHAVVEVPAVQSWQGLDGFTVPVGKRTPLMKQSATQVPPLQTSPLAQLVPSGSSDHVVVEVAGVQTRQAFAASTVPAGMRTPPMKQSATQVPLLQTSPEAQLVPSASSDQVVVEVAGLQTWQAFAGFTVPSGKRTPPMKQSATQVPLLQTSPDAQLVPSGSSDHAAVEVAGVQI
jgi:hypothetical protein